MESKVYNQAGKEVGKIKLPENVFGLPWNEKLVSSVANGILNNKRVPTAHTKTRGEVSGTGAKPWKQKGTGRARHGSRRSPLWVGGGVSHGPRNDRNYAVKINKKAKTKALFSLLSRKLKDGEIVFLENISFKVPKTKEAKGILSSIAKVKEFDTIIKRKNAAFMAMSEKNEGMIKSFRNFNNLELGLTKDLNVLDLLQYKFLIVTDPEKSVEALSARLK